MSDVQDGSVYDVQEGSVFYDVHDGSGWVSYYCTMLIYSTCTSCTIIIYDFTRVKHVIL